RKHGLPRERLRFWTRRREGKEGARTAMSFVPVEVAPAERSAAGREQGEAVQVEVGGVAAGGPLICPPTPSTCWSGASCRPGSNSARAHLAQCPECTRRLNEAHVSAELFMKGVQKRTLEQLRQRMRS
ncbi:MAG TPA: hypothetical protein VFZ09_21710, partial [Archangium sp.]|nr:hypothetical protein [Archangium sp.]